MEIKTSWEITDDTADSWNQTLTKETDNQKKWVAVDELLTFVEISCASQEDYDDMSERTKGYIDAMRELEEKLNGPIQ